MKRIITHITAALILCLQLLSFNSFSQDGTLDNTFGSGGRVLLDNNNPVGSSNSGRAIAIQSDGKIILAGTFSNSGYSQLMIARINSSGSLDNSFGNAGITTLFGYQDSYTDIAIQSDDKIVVCSQHYTNPNDFDFAVRRFKTNGTLDSTFGTGGRVITQIASNTNDVSQALAIQSDGKIVLVGHSGSSTSYDYAVARYNTNGSLDNTFNGTGKAKTSIVSGQDYGTAVIIQPDDKIIVGGNSYNGSDYDFSMIRYNSNGSLDISFDIDGKVITPIGTGNDYVNSALLQSDGKIILGGRSFNGINDDFALARFNSDGSLDTTFGSAGKVITSIGSSNSIIYGMSLQSDGKIIVTGSSNNGSNLDITLARYNTDGSLDATFGSGGIVITNFMLTADLARAVDIQADAKIVIVGQAHNGSDNDFAIVRYNNTCPLSSQPSAINGNSSICSGTTHTYSISAVSGATGYTWAVPSDATINSGQGTTSISVTYGTSSGNVSVTADNACGSSSAQLLSITVNTSVPSQPGSVSGTTTVCTSTTHTYSISSVSGATGYTWSVPSGATINSGQGTTSISVTYGTNSGNIIVTADNSCGSSTAQSLSITVNTAPAQPGSVSGTTTVCSGTTHTYSISAVSGATGYTWSVPSGATINSGQGTTSISVTYGTSSGNVSVTADNTCGGSAAQTTSVTVNAYPSNAVTQSGNTLTATETGATYQWLDCDNGNSNISATSQSFTPTVSGSYAVEVTKNGCTATSSCTSVTIIIDNIPASFSKMLNIYPNPSNGIFTIETGFDKAQYVAIEISNVLGKQIFSTEEFSASSDYKKQIDLSNQSKGVYFVQVKTEQGAVTKKVVKE